MSHQLKREYLIVIRERYRNSSRGKKSLILDEFCHVCGYARKYAIAILNGHIDPSESRPRGRQVKYTTEVVFHLVRLWSAMGMPGSTKLKAALSEWIGYDEHPALQEQPELTSKLLAISRSQMDRLLKPYRTEPQRGISATRPGCNRVKNQIPIQPKDWNVTKPGQQMQGDTVAHCGNALAGQFVNSLTVTDIFSAWTENRALWGKGSAAVIQAMRDIEVKLPFVLSGFKSDSGSEFMNKELIVYFLENRPEVPVKFTRSRPYKKDDNCYVEQKNFTHVRELFGYARLDSQELVELMNRIYTECWGPLQNFFMPTQKLLRKTRIGARIKKEYEPAVTPYQRLMNSLDLTAEQKQALKHRKAALNPFQLQKELKVRLEEFEEILRQRNTGLLAASTCQTAHPAWVRFLHEPIRFYELAQIHHFPLSPHGKRVRALNFCSRMFSLRQIGPNKFQRPPYSKPREQSIHMPNTAFILRSGKIDVHPRGVVFDEAREEVSSQNMIGARALHALKSVSNF